MNAEEGKLKEQIAIYKKNLQETEKRIKRTQDLRRTEEFVRLGLPDAPRSLPLNAVDWELYCSEPGAREAGERLTKAFVSVLKAFKIEAREDVCEAALVAAATMRGAMSKEAKFGATDSEPRYHAEQTILDYGRKLGYEMDADWLW